MYQDWQQLEQAALACTKCQLCKTRTHVVFGDGSRQAEVMFVGEGPGQNEDEQGVPFVGRAGQLLDKLLYSIGLDREHVYIANMVKCRPPQNRDPKPEETEACLGYLRAQTAFIRPKIIVCLGRIAAMRLISPNFRITKEHGLWYEKNGYYLTALYHPAALLRDPAKKNDTMRDLHQLEAKIREVCTRTYESERMV